MNEEDVMAGIESSIVGVKQKMIYSEFLEREVIIDVYLPKQSHPGEEAELLLINDGQDLRKINFAEILNSALGTKTPKFLICVGIHCNADRMNEYGTICRPDYKGRGAKAGLYCKFILDELLPFLKLAFGIRSIKEKSVAGFSLGGLSAIDLAWNYPNEFSKVGVFSGSLWWRRRGYEEEGYDGDKDRIMHLQVQKGSYKPGLKFFFECGRLDETADRNNNGIIDSIEDTTDLIEDLKGIGYTDKQIAYLELEDGRHDMETWGRAFPTFLKWGWGE